MHTNTPHAWGRHKYRYPLTVREEAPDQAFEYDCLAAIAGSVIRNRPRCVLATGNGAVEKAAILILSNDANRGSTASHIA